MTPFFSLHEINLMYGRLNDPVFLFVKTYSTLCDDLGNVFLGLSYCIYLIDAYRFTDRLYYL